MGNEITRMMKRVLTFLLFIFQNGSPETLWKRKYMSVVVFVDEMESVYIGEVAVGVEPCRK